MLHTLDVPIEVASSDCAQALVALRSGFWSFGEMPIAGAVRGDA